MRCRSFVLLLPLLLIGCLSSPVQVQFMVVDQALSGKKAVIQSITMDPEFYSRGCVIFKTDGDEILLALSQDGTSDWMIGRTLSTTAGEIAAASLAFLNTPFRVIEKLLTGSTQEMQPPSEERGCDPELLD